MLYGHVRTFALVAVLCPEMERRQQYIGSFRASRDRSLGIMDWTSRLRSVGAAPALSVLDIRLAAMARWWWRLDFLAPSEPFAPSDPAMCLAVS